MLDGLRDATPRTEFERDENGMIIMPSERETAPPPKTGGLANMLFIAALAAAGIGGYVWMQNAPPAAPLAANEREDEALRPVVVRQQLASNETLTPDPPAPRASASAQPAPTTAEPAAAPSSLNAVPAPSQEQLDPVAPTQIAAPPQ